MHYLIEKKKKKLAGKEKSYVSEESDEIDYEYCLFDEVEVMPQSSFFEFEGKCLLVYDMFNTFIKLGIKFCSCSSCRKSKGFVLSVFICFIQYFNELF